MRMLCSILGVVWGKEGKEEGEGERRGVYIVCTYLLKFIYIFIFYFVFSKLFIFYVCSCMINIYKIYL